MLITFEFEILEETPLFCSLFDVAVSLQRVENEFRNAGCKCDFHLSWVHCSTWICFVGDFDLEVQRVKKTQLYLAAGSAWNNRCHNR